MIDNLEQDLDQDLGGLPILKKSSESTSEDLGGLPILKKKAGNLVSSVTPSPLPSQPDFLKQGASLADNSFLKEISKSIPKGPAKPAAPEGKWSNIVQNVFANFEKAGTDLAANATTLAKDFYQAANPYAPNIPSTKTETEKAVATPWELDPFGNVIRGLHGNQERMQQVIANNPLPNTFWGKAVSSVASFAPDIAATALLPEAKLAQGASFLAKTGNLLFNNFTKYMMAKEGLAGYGEARKEGKDIGEAALEGVKGTGRGMATGMEMAILGAGSNLATKSIMSQAEKIGLTGVKGMAAKELVNLGTDVLAYGIISPFANAALEGRAATGEEIANGTGVAALFRLKGAAENIKSNAELNKAIKETLSVKQGVAISNFVDATPESIVEVYNSKGSADELQLRALEAAKKARQTTDLQKKAQYTAEAGVLGRAAGVKQVADMVINNKDGFAEFKASDLPQSAKEEFLQKAEEINKLLNPLKKQEVDLDNKIKESEDLFSQFSQQAQEAQDPNQRAEFEAKAREVKDNADNFRNQLSEVKFNQNRPDVNAGKEPVMEGEVTPTEVKVTEEVKPTEVKSVEQLRQQEQAELDSKIPNAEQYRVDGKVDRAKLVNEEDIKAFDEVYNKYDKLISPLLEKPAEKKITVELLSSQEPPQKEGETIVTLSGKTEAERLASIAQRQKDTKVSDKVVSDNEIVQAAESYFKKSGNYKNSAEGRAELNDLRIKARESGLTIDTERDAVTKPNKAGRPTKVRYNNKADGEAVVEPNAKTLRDRDIDTQKVYEELTDSGVFLDVEAESGKRMSAAQVEAAIKDINEGIPSKRANKYLDALEKGIAEDAFPLYDKGRGGFAPKLSEIRAELGVEKEVVGEPMDEAAFNKFLDEESKLTPEEEQDLLDNVENLLYEYETTEAGPEGKVQPTETGAKEGVPSEAKPSEPVKSERQAEYEKIKSNKKKKDFVRNNLPEEFKPLADELTDAQMSEIVKSDFDLKTIKNIQDAVQKQSAAEVLQPKQEGDGGTGGERKRVEQGKQGDESAGEGKAKAAEEAQPKGAKEGKVEELKTNDKSILNRINSSENIPDSVKEKFKDDLKYEVKSKEEAKSIAKNIIKEYGTDDAVTLAESNKFHGDVNSFIFSEAINDTYIKEAEAKTPEEKLKYAEQWADYAIRFDESARSKGRFISAISDFYKKSPLGIKFVENERRTEDFKKWYKGKEGSYKEVFDELVKDPQFKSLIGEEVQKGLKEERAAQRESNRKKIEDFFDNAKLKGNNLYAVPIPPKLINGALEIMKQAVLAGETVTYAVNQAIQHISKEVKDWDKEKFRKEYEEKLSSIEGKGGKKVKEELPEDAKGRILEKFRKKLKGLDESQKEKVIRKSFKTLVENGALEYNDFKKIIAETIGYGEVTPEEAAKITKLVNDINSVDELASSIRNDENRSEASLLKYQKAKKEAEKSATELNKMVYNKTNISNRLLSIMQLNTLGIPSLVNNPVFNIWNQATVRFPNAVSMTVLDQILYGGSKVSNKLFGTDVLLPENNVVASQKEFFKKLWQGGKLSTEQLFTGLTNRDYFQKEIYSSQIHPFTSAKDLWDWKFNGKNLTPAQVADKSIQATVGLPAEIVARALNIGDKPQRFAAEGAQAAVFAKNLGLKDIDYKYFLEFPKEEAYRTFKKQGLSDEAAMKKAEEIQDRIIKQGEESTFQQENLLNDMINAAFNKAGTAGDIFKRFNMPFLKIPLNAFWSSYNLVNPEVAFLQSAVYGVKAIKSRSAIDIQQSKKWFAHGVTGIALTGIAGALVSNGIVNSDNRNETTKKERLGEKTYEQQNSINVTKLNAYLRGENPDDVKNSLNVDLKWFGNVGNVLNVEALKQEEMTPEQRKDGMSYMEDMFSGMKISSMELIENGVFSSTSGLLTAIDKGGSFADSYFLNLINMGTNIVQPAMFAQMSRAQLPYYSQQKADTFMEQIKNNLLTRSSTVRALSGKYPPSQVGVWGDVLDRKDNFAMKLFGISSNNKDNFAQPIYEDYKKTDNTAFLPPSVKPEVNGFELNTSQSKQFEIMVGQARKNLAAPFVNDGAKLSGFKDRYSKLSEEDKVKALGIIYKMGYQVAEDEFTKLYPQFYKSNKKTPEEKKESKESSIFRKSLKKFIR